MPGVGVTIQEMMDALEKVGGKDKLASIKDHGSGTGEDLEILGNNVRQLKGVQTRLPPGFRIRAGNYRLQAVLKMINVVSRQDEVCEVRL